MRDAKGDLPAFGRGSFKIKPVEDAVWATDIGKPTDVIREGNSYYIAQPVEKQDAVVKPFEDTAVQDAIRADREDQAHQASTRRPAAPAQGLGPHRRRSPTRTRHRHGHAALHAMARRGGQVTRLWRRV
ncbi:MAG: hypothetical protein QM770_15515 [Tepidisphaeraceae bacterium]